MNSNIETANSFMVGCVLVDILYAFVIFWCFRRLWLVVRKSGLSTFGVSGMVSVLWFGALGTMFSLALFVSSSSGYYEYQKIVSAKSGKYTMSIPTPQISKSPISAEIHIGKGVVEQKK